MKKKYYVEITETLQKVVEVEAESEEEAVNQVHIDYINERYVLTPDDWADTMVEAYHPDYKVVFPQDMRTKEE
jgi:pyridoxal biosynthesis lyase PdxS